MRYLLIDSNNLFNRAIHVTKGSADLRAAMAIHIIFMSIAQSWRLFNADHVMVALDCRSDDNWRKKYSKKYKLNRAELKLTKTPKEVETENYLYSVYNKYINFLKEKTNISVIQCPVAEADDIIAYWTQKYNKDEHIIVSSDKDFRQLLKKNIIQFNGIDKKIFGVDSCELLENISSKLPDKFEIVTEEDPEYLLFEKIIRGDSGDNVFSAFPGVRKNPSKGKPGIIPAYNDRYNKGYDWNTFMLHRWIDVEGNEQSVKECFELNKILVDLTQQPEYVKNILDQSLEYEKEPCKSIGFNFFKFCNEIGLEKLQDRAEEITQILSSQRE